MFTAIGTIEKCTEKKKNDRIFNIVTVNFGGDEKAVIFTEKQLETGTQYLFIITTERGLLKVSPVCKVI